MITDAHRQYYQANGYVVVEGQFSRDEVDGYLDHFMTLRQEGPKAMDDTVVDGGANDPLRKFPRLIQTHRWDVESVRWLLDERLKTCLTTLLGNEPLAAQTMVYF